MRVRMPALIVASVVLAAVSGAYAGSNSTESYRTAERMAIAGDFDAAIGGFRKTLEINPHYALAHYGLGKACLYRAGMLKQAVYHLEKAVGLDKGLARGYFYLGIAYMLSRKYGQSLNAFSAAYERDGSLVEALYNMAVVYDLIRKNTMALKSYERYLLEKNKRDSDILF